jgi:AcrR family transcriptional regulator
MRQARHSAACSDTALGVEDRLVATASELFYREGVRAVGIQRVIEEAGVAKASLYAHFESKDELVAACLDQRICKWRAHVDAHLAQSALDARGKLLLLFDLQVEWIRSPEFRGCPLQSVGTEIADPAHPAKRVMAGHRQWLHDLVTTLARDAGLQPLEEVVGALIVLYDGASAAALVDGNAGMAGHARWAVERVIDASRSRAAPRIKRDARSKRRRT